MALCSDTEARWLEVEGTRLEYAWHGPGPHEGPTLVFLHEGLGCVGLWKDFPRRIAGEIGCGALVYSRLGYGASDPVDLPRPLTYLHDEALKTLPRVLDAAGVERAVLVGHSDGASIALINAGGVHDRRVRGLVLEAPHVLNEQACVDAVRAVVEAYRTGDLRARLARYHGDNVDGAFWGWSQAWLAPGFWHWNIEEYLAGVTVPAMSIQGEDDAYGTRAHIEAIERQVAGMADTLWIPACGHSPHVDQPERVAAAIARFVASLALDRAAPATSAHS